MNTVKRKRRKFTQDWRFWLSLFGCLIMIFIIVRFSLGIDSGEFRYDVPNGSRYSGGGGLFSIAGLVIFATGYNAYYLAKGKDDRLCTAIASLVALTIAVFSVLWATSLFV